MPRLKVRPEAEADALEVAFWYEGERAGLGLEFSDALRATFARIEKSPSRPSRICIDTQARGKSGSHGNPPARGRRSGCHDRAV